MSVALHPQFVVDESGKAHSVLLSTEAYDALLDRLEDFEDSLTIYRMSLTAKPEDFIPWEDFKAELKAEGLLPDDF